MAYVSTPSLVTAASHNGCLAFLAAGYSKDPEGIRRDIATLDAAGTATWGVGFIVWALEESDVVFEETLKHNPPFLWFSFGIPTRFTTRARDVLPNVKIFVQVQSVAEAILAAESFGTDAVVVQGREAGGHGVGDTASVFTLLPEAADAVDEKVLVLAAGGITDGRQLAACLLLGADGVVMGTRFAVCDESGMHPYAKDRIVAAGEGGKFTTRTRLYNKLRRQNWPMPYDFRVLKNSATNAGDLHEVSDNDYSSLESLHDAAVASKNKTPADFDFIAVACGEGVGLIKERTTTADLIASLMANAEAHAQSKA
ncbi:hypothetical protein HDU84_005550 [Entophlyctis sp. JEL0112]|nr:hypothetical protein HDU84_005550 [Entophlyctis sp. JEL0112]